MKYTEKQLVKMDFQSLEKAVLDYWGVEITNDYYAAKHLYYRETTRDDYEVYISKNATDKFYVSENVCYYEDAWYDDIIEVIENMMGCYIYFDDDIDERSDSNLPELYEQAFLDICKIENEKKDEERVDTQ
tara:strand:- start:13946 stop:14338 length:393 start_codon:yes stop_codon:yes gene_type:complete